MLYDNSLALFDTDYHTKVTKIQNPAQKPPNVGKAKVTARPATMPIKGSQLAFLGFGLYVFMASL
jgi:hypothetical protein